MLWAHPRTQRTLQTTRLAVRGYYKKRRERLCKGWANQSTWLRKGRPAMFVFGLGTSFYIFGLYRNQKFKTYGVHFSDQLKTSFFFWMGGMFFAAAGPYKKRHHLWIALFFGLATGCVLA